MKLGQSQTYTQQNRQLKKRQVRIRVRGPGPAFRSDFLVRPLHAPQAPNPGVTGVRHAPTYSPTVPRRTPRRTTHHTHISFYYYHLTVRHGRSRLAIGACGVEGSRLEVRPSERLWRGRHRAIGDAREGTIGLQYLRGLGPTGPNGERPPRGLLQGL